MFGQQFYPTPELLIIKMLKGYERGYSEQPNALCNMQVLEPSAGKGDIADAINERNHRNKNVDVLEIDDNLRAILAEKEHRVVGKDFLTFRPDKEYDLIIMNPPFKNGDKHLLHAWDIAGNTDIVCILNAQTIKNPNTQAREALVNLINDFGTVEYLKEQFVEAERRTSVEVALIRLTKKVAAHDDPFFIDMEQEKEFNDFDELSEETELVQPNVIDDHVRMYENCKEATVELVRAVAKVHLYASHIMAKYDGVDKFIKEELCANPKAMYNGMVDQMNRSAWKNIFSKTNMESLMTSTVQRNFNQWSRQQGRMAFTRENIEEMFSTLFNNQDMIMRQTILDMFDYLTKHHEENRYGEGWKTNDAFKVNKKAIMGWLVEHDITYSMDNRAKFGFRIGSSHERLDDLDKALCMVVGWKFNDIYKVGQSIKQAMSRQFDELGKVGPGKFENTCESYFFKIKFFKKGTIHLEFKDEWVWEQFNIIVANERNWLPYEYRNKYKPRRNYPILEQLELQEAASKNQLALDVGTTV